MPYIESDDRGFLHTHPNCADSTGELNYVITRLLDSWLDERGVSYTHINAAIGVLECAKLELYRRVAAPYEDTKKEENGDVYSSAM